jgi:hypothetical protein
MFSAVFISSDLVAGGGTGVVVVGVEVSVVEGVAVMGGATIGGATGVVGFDCNNALHDVARTAGA